MNSITTVRKPTTPTPSPAPTTTSTIQNLFDLLKLLIPLIFDPIGFLQVYFWTMSPSSTKFRPATDIPSLAGKVILVTGGNAGLGRETVLQLAKHQPSKIFLAARTESKGMAAIEAINAQLSPHAANNTTNITYLPLDLSSLKSIKAAAEEFTLQSDRLDILILNAGIMATPPGKSASGHDMQLATNHVGHHLLTKLLLLTLLKTAGAAAAEPASDVRVITLASSAHDMAPLDIDTIMSTEKLCAQGPWTRYGASKAANILFAAELARRYGGGDRADPADRKLTSVSLHPGMVKTDLFAPARDAAFTRFCMAIAPFMFASVPNGALNTLYLAAGAEKGELINGSYYTPVGKARADNKYVRDVEGARRLWEWTEAELGKAGY